VERRLLRRAAYAAGGLVVLAGAVVALRNADTPSTQKAATPPPVQTTVKEYADDGVLAPQVSGRPSTPKDLRVVPGPHRLQVTWNADAPGYDVELRANGDVQRTKLVTDTAAQFDGLDDVEYEVQVRAVDAFGQRSDPAVKKDRPVTWRPDESRYGIVDHFDGQFVPSASLWRLANNAACARMARGAGDDSRRLVISAACGSESVALRSRTPLRLAQNASELGRLMIETDAPGTDGELAVDLVPGPADLIETSSRGGLPPGTIRIRVTPTALEIVGTQPIPLAKSHNGISARWEFVFGSDGIHVLRDGTLLGSAPVVPAWTEATPLFSFTGPANGLNFVGVDAVGISGRNTPNLVMPPRVTTTTGSPAAGTQPVGGQIGGQLRMTIRSYYGQTIPGPFSVEVAGRTFPAQPAVAGQVFEPGVRFPLVVDLPADAILTNDRGELAVGVHSADPAKAPQVQHADIELTAEPNTLSMYSMPEPERLRRPRPVLAGVTAALLDAAGGAIENGKPSPRGRVVLEVTLAGSGDLAGVAGVEVWVDDKRIAGIPANHDGPGVAGRFRLALNTSAFQVGVRNIDIKAISTDPGASPQLTSIPWQIPS
jgi:hypothetical protein